MIADFDTAAVVVAVVAGVVPTAVVGLGVAAVAVAARHLNSAVFREKEKKDCFHSKGGYDYVRIFH